MSTSLVDFRSFSTYCDLDLTLCYIENLDQFNAPYLCCQIGMIRVAVLDLFINLQRWAKRRALGCEKFQPGSDWLLLSKTGPPFSPSM